MSDPITYPYPAGNYTVEEPDAPHYHRIRLPDGQVTSVTGDSSQPITAAEIETALATPPAPTEDTTASWEAFLAGSITDPDTGIALKASFKARNDFVGQVTLIREALDAGLLTAASPMSIWDAANTEHALTVAQIRSLLLRYGIAWQTAFNQLAP
jgi:hypothetical protein